MHVLRFELQVLVCSIAYVNCPSIKIRVLPREDIERSVVPAVLTVTNDMQRQVCEGVSKERQE